MSVLERIPLVKNLKKEWQSISFEVAAEDYVDRASRSFAEDTLVHDMSFEESRKIAEDCDLNWEIIMDWRFYMQCNPNLLPVAINTNQQTNSDS